jgi:hypothetical protein
MSSRPAVRGRAMAGHPVHGHPVAVGTRRTDQATDRVDTDIGSADVFLVSAVRLGNSWFVRDVGSRIVISSWRLKGALLPDVAVYVPSNKRFIYATPYNREQTIAGIDTQTGQHLFQIVQDFGENIYDLKSNNDGDKFVVMWANKLSIMDTQDGACLWSCSDVWFRSFPVFTFDDSSLIVAVEDGILVRSSLSGETTAIHSGLWAAGELEVDNSDIDVVLYAGITKNVLASIDSADGLPSSRLAVWDYLNGQNIFTVRTDEPIICLCFGPNDAAIVISNQKNISVFDSLTGNVLRAWPITRWAPDRMAYSYSRNVLVIAVCSDLITVAFINFESGSISVQMCGNRDEMLENIYVTRPGVVLL